ncbi:hypothetical protein ACQ4PT_046709 [Festuca glaucescens]
MARSSTRNETTQARPPATSPLQQFPGVPLSTCANPTPPPHFYSAAPASSSTNPTTPPHFYPGAPMPANPSLNQWRPMYTTAPDGLLSFGQLPPTHMYNFHPPPMHYHEQGNQRMENFHFVGTTSQDDSFSTPPPPPHPKAASRSAPAKVNSTSSKRKRKSINVDDDELSERTAQRLSYTPEEHVRLAGAWLECSIDPINGNGKKGEKFWDDIAALYNSTTPSNRKRDQNHLKQEWQRTKKRLGAFHGNSPSGGTNLTTNLTNLEDEKRPLAGRDKARAERAGKGKAREVSHELGEKLDKFIEVNNQSMEERQKVMETQVFLSNRQLEIAKIANKTKMLDVYQNILLADTSRMDDAAKAGRAKALKNMESILFPQGDTGDQGE